MSNELLTITDLIAWMTLKDFVQLQFPSADPRKQVDAAYTYAELMADRRTKVEGTAITGATIRTSLGNPRIELDSSGMRQVPDA